MNAAPRTAEEAEAAYQEHCDATGGYPYISQDWFYRDVADTPTIETVGLMRGDD